MTNISPEGSPGGSGDSPPGGRFIGGVFGFVFLGIGVAVIIFLWSAPFGAFGSPPLFFRIFGSLIAVAFVAMGGTVAVAAIKGVRPNLPLAGRFRQAGRQHASGQSKFACPRCSAPLSDQVDVSPHGDVKCTHCESWFNIHAN